ncbi:Golgi SNAP receptor complex member 1, partial [Aphanomyces cochlioides]
MSDRDDDDRRSASADRRSNRSNSDRGSVDRREDSDHRSTSRGRDRTNSRDEKEDKPRGPMKPGISLLVRNLNKSSNADDIKELFARYGEVRDVYTPLDFYTKESRGFAFVEF